MSKMKTVITIGDNVYYSRYTAAGIERAKKVGELIPVEDSDTGSFGYINSRQSFVFTSLDAA